MLGYGVIESDGQMLRYIQHGCIVTSSESTVGFRLRVLYDSLREVRQRFSVTDVGMESLFHSRNVRTALAVGQARGVALLATVDNEVVFGEYTPTEVKQAVSGYGGARKRQMQEMVRLLLGLPSLPTPDDAADALAVAICHARQVALADILGRR
jgi:crossover junction endodeoxyribonuclease RuvC